ncbi:MAG: hypothetical protein KDA63_09470 [Planctomycetales bacterium]|nr:hypothetical protein [Planctomycetales bacterium]
MCAIPLRSYWPLRSQLGGVLAVLIASSVATAAEPLPTNGEPSRQIRFHTADEADVHRERLVRFIWPAGLPTTALPSVSRDVAGTDEVVAADLEGVDLDRVASIDRLVVDVAGWDFLARVYLFHPQNTARANRLVVVHQGHSVDLGYGVADTVNFLLDAGLTVAVAHMPLAGWNDDADGVLDDGSAFSAEDRGTRGHNELYNALADKIDGQTFRLFLEPVVQTINQFIADVPEHGEIAMIGLSGGGWTTHMMAAVDTRIATSVPVAGSSPLYIRNEDDSSRGDAEQVYAPLYDEDIRDDGSGGGVATWLEIYSLGGFGNGRRQTMVTNEHDSCCFSGRPADSFKQIVTHCVEGELASGSWSHVLDSSHHEHKISSPVRRDVIAPLLGLDD